MNIPELLDKARLDPQAFIPIYHHFYPRVYAYVAYRVGRADDAEDIVSEVFMRVIAKLHRFEHRGQGSFSAWLFRIASNEVNRFYNRNRHGSDNVPLDVIPEIESDNLPVELMVQKKEQFIYLRQLIEQLSPRRQEIVQLKFFGELRNIEIADTLGLDERTVAAHLSRALNDLREMARQGGYIHA